LLESKIPILNWYGTATNMTYITDDEDKNELQWVQNQSVLSTWNRSMYTPLGDSWWSPDHHKLLIAMENGAGTEVQLLLANTGSTDFKQIADHLTFYGYLITPSWSPDGRHIVFSSDLESPGNNDIYSLDVQSALNDPATRPIRLTTSGFGENEPVWQPQP
jgi:Tol biopolymer transport system component